MASWEIEADVASAAARMATVEVEVVVAELNPERRRARLACACRVAGQVVLDGEALVKVPSRETAPPRPLVP